MYFEPFGVFLFPLLVGKTNTDQSGCMCLYRGKCCPDVNFIFDVLRALQIFVECYKKRIILLVA